MSKIAIISQPDQGVLIDVGGCSTLQEATQHLTSTLQISSQFWSGLKVELNLGQLQLTEQEVAQVVAIAAEVGIKPDQVFANNDVTRRSLSIHNIKLATGQPMSLPVIETESAPVSIAVIEEPAALAEPAPTADNTEEVKVEIQEAAEVKEEPKEEAKESKVVPPPAVLYLRQTLRSGQAVSHKGHLVIIGDVNPGAEVMADGDITIWGALRGMAHAGMSGDTTAEIRALRIQAIQLRIANSIARAPDRPRKSFANHSGPETARIVNGTIRIAANVPD